MRSENDTSDGDDDDAGDFIEDADRDAQHLLDADRDAEIMDADADADVDADEDDGERCWEPIVLYTFEGLVDASRIPDEAPRDPDLPLEPAGSPPWNLEIEGGGIRFYGGRLQATRNASRELGEALLTSDAMTVEVIIRDPRLTNTGPARIVTYSQNTAQRAFTLGQQNDEFIVWLKSTATDNNGVMGASGRLAHHIPRILVDDQPHHLLMTWEGESASTRVYVDGVFLETHEHVTNLGEEGELLWDLEENRFALGNELTGNRQYWGVIEEVAIYDIALDDLTVARCARQAGF